MHANLTRFDQLRQACRAVLPFLSFPVFLASFLRLAGPEAIAADTILHPSVWHFIAVLSASVGAAYWVARTFPLPVLLVLNFFFGVAGALVIGPPLMFVFVIVGSVLFLYCVLRFIGEAIRAAGRKLDRIDSTEILCRGLAAAVKSYLVFVVAGISIAAVDFSASTVAAYEGAGIVRSVEVSLPAKILLVIVGTPALSYAGFVTARLAPNRKVLHAAAVGAVPILAFLFVFLLSRSSTFSFENVFEPVVAVGNSMQWHIFDPGPYSFYLFFGSLLGGMVASSAADPE